MSVQRFDLVNHQEEYESAEMIGFVDGDYVLHSDYAALDARCAEMERERDALKAELERERVRLAGCGVAAMGYEDKEPLEPGSYGYSASYDDVLRFRKQLIAERDALQAKLAAAEEALRRIVMHEMPGAKIARAYLAGHAPATPMPAPVINAHCNKCGWTGLDTELFDNGLFVYCPKCRASDGFIVPAT